MRRLFPCIFWICLAGNLLHGLQAQTRDTLRLTLEINTPNLASALEAIETQSPLRFFYKSAWLPNDSISLSLEKNSIAASFDRLLAGTGLVAILLQDRTFAIVPRERWLDLGGPIVSLEPTPSSNLSVSGSQERDSVGNPNKLPSGQEALLTGIIRDGNTQEIISGATIKVPILSKGALTDESGSFQLALPLGEFQASVEAAGYDPLVRTVVILGDGTWDVDMDLKAYSLDAVELEGEATDRNVSSTLIGVNELKIGQIQGIPAFMGEVDVVKSLLTLPGVNTVGEGASGFNVRGGNVDQNLILLDGTPVLNSSHVLGFFSLFHPDIVNKITLYKGHIPAQYGGRLASVLDVGMRRGNFRKFHMKGGVGLVSTRLLMEGPLVHEKVSFLVGMRTSYSNWALRLVSDPLIKSSSARFSDLNGKLSFKINPKQRLDLSAYRSRDLFQYADQFGYSWGTGLVQGQYQYIFNPRTALTVRLQNGRYTADFFDPAGRDAFRLHTGISYTRGTARLRHTPSRVHDIQAGIEWINHRTLPEQIAPGSFNSLIPNNQIPKDRGHEFGLFLQDEWTLTPFISLSAGLRASGFVQTGARTIYEYAENQSRSLSNIVDSTTYGPLQPIQQYGGLEPRVALRVNLDESSSVKVSYNRIQQYIHLVSNTTASTPVDIWQLSNRYVPPQRAHSYSAGYFRNFA
ncbi:MAG: TonB-dependent receptor, partial [Bacteroidota bacterium]